MTDRTHPDSGRIITSGDVIAELQDRIAELEAELEAVNAASPTHPAEQQATKETSGGFHVWRDISTAPKDGSRFVATGHNYGLYSEVRHACVAQWFRGCWIEASDWNETSELKYLTHWMPLPSLPDDVAAPAEQQAAPKAAPESFLDGADVQDESRVIAYYSREAVFACITAALESVAATKAAPGEQLTREQIRKVFMTHGFTIKEGQTDLKQYVYDAAYALLELVAAPQQEASKVASGFWMGEKLGIYTAPQQKAQEPCGWDGAEEWEKLAWHLCAEENGEDACNDLIWEGGPMPEPWGDRWLKYEGEARRMIALVRTHVPAPQPAPAPLSDDLLEALQEIVEDLEQGAIPNANDPWWRKARNAITAAIAAQEGTP